MIQKAVKTAAKLAGIVKPATPPLVVPLLEAGASRRGSQAGTSELLILED